MNETYVLTMEHISKSFGANNVLDDVSIRIKPGEVVALIGENGAGKSTLMNILFGMPVIANTGGYSGTIRFEGREINIASPMAAMQYGIGMVHQEFMLIDGYDVAENIKLNRENTRPTLLRKLFGDRLNLLDQNAIHSDARRTLETLHLDIDADMRVGSLAVGYKQFIEIARELDKSNVKLVVLDEPTAVLTEIEARRFIECVRSVAQRGVAFIFISHKLQEVKDLADHVFVLRDGVIVGDESSGAMSIKRMSELMIGRSIELRVNDQDDQAKMVNLPCVEMEDFAVAMPGEPSYHIDLTVHKGEIFGIGGLAGHGKLSIANGILGQYPTRGTVCINGQAITPDNISQTLKMGVAFVSEDRRGAGLLLEDSIATNICIAAMRLNDRFTKRVMGLRLYDEKAANAYAQEMIERLNINCTGPQQKVQRLSGGNQQKVCIARAIAAQPQILFVSEPTRGIDIGAKKIVLDTLKELNDQGVTIIITSSELAELRSICDRIAIVAEGRVAGILKPQDTDETYGLLMSGITGMPPKEG